MAVWIGIAIMIFAFGGAQASAGAKFWRGQFQPIGIVYLLLVALGAYSAFRGLYGEWWRVVRVALDNRKLKTCRGEVLPLDELGELSIAGTQLRAASAKTPLYMSSAADLRQVRGMIESLVRRGPRNLFRLRRLAYHRSIGLFLFTLVGFAMLVGVTIGESHTTLRELSYEPEYKLMLLLGYGVSFMWFRRALFGSFSKDQLYVDPAAGVLQLEDGSFARLDELGEISIKTRSQRSSDRRHTFTNHDLHAANVGMLYTSLYESQTLRRRDALATAILQHQLRRVLEAPHVEGDVFRGGIDPAVEVRRIAGDSPYRRAALAALTTDPDPTVRSRAAQLVGT